MKKIISIMLSAVLALSCCVCAFSATIYMGDVDMNGDVNAKDARTVLRFGARLEKPKNDTVKRIADMNGSGFVNSADARLVLRTSARLIPKKKFNASSVATTTKKNEKPTEKPTEKPKVYVTTDNPARFSKDILPTSVVAFITNRYYLKGDVTTAEGTKNMTVATNANGDIKVTIKNTSTKNLKNPMSVLVAKDTKDSSKNKVYVLCEDPEYMKYFEFTSLLKKLLKPFGLDIESEINTISKGIDVDVSKLNVTSFSQDVDYDGVYTTKYTFTSSTGYVQFDLTGNSVTTITSRTYDGSSSTVISVDTLRYSNKTDLSLDGHGRVSLLGEFIGMDGDFGPEAFWEFFNHIVEQEGE